MCQLRIFWVLVVVGFSALRMACAQSPTVLDLEVRVERITGAVLGLSIPVEATGATSQELGIQESATQIRLELPADILFDFDKAEIRPSAAHALHQVADLVRTRATGPVRVEGHTDSKGSAGYNQVLSKRRADAVRLWLMHTESLKSVTFIAAGFGATKPVAPNTAPDGSDDPVGRQRNRRVELLFQKH
jgi:outer membrane protein OmpA-like peptidoglycan-associated protein